MCTNDEARFPKVNYMGADEQTLPDRGSKWRTLLVILAGRVRHMGERSGRVITELPLW